MAPIIITPDDPTPGGSKPDEQDTATPAVPLPPRGRWLSRVRAAMPWTILFLTMLLFVVIVIAASVRPDTAAGACELAWSDSRTPDNGTRIDVKPGHIHVGDQVCIRVTTGKPAKDLAPTRKALSSLRKWHLRLANIDVGTAVGRPAEPGAPLYLSYLLPAPASAVDPRATNVAALWKGGFSSADLGTRQVSLRLDTEASAGSAGIGLLKVAPADLQVFTPWIIGAGAILLCLFSTGIIWLAANTSLLRDGQDTSSPFSLARSQMAFWFALTAAGYCYIWLLTGIWQDVVTSTTLLLLGISATTGLGAAAITAPKADQRTNGFFLDILSETSEGSAMGVTVHRLVELTWTVILGGVFITHVLWSQRFPDFDAIVLTLMGLSSGVYVGFKWLNS